MIIVGAICLVLGLIFGIHLLWIAGVVLVVVGLILVLVGSTGHPVGGRRHWF